MFYVPTTIALEINESLMFSSFDEVHYVYAHETSQLGW